MSDLSVYVTIETQDVDRMVERLWETLTGPSLETFLRGPVHEYLEDEIVGRFAYEGDKKSGPWPPLTDATQNIRQQLGYSADEINIRSGEMFDTLTHRADYLAAEGSAEMILPGSAGEHEPMKTKLRTAAQGSNKNPMGFGPTPPRPVLAVDEEDLAALLERMTLWVDSRVAGVMV